MPEIKISDIKIGGNRRPVISEAVDRLVKSIQETCLLNPITVSSEMILVAGAHRLEAFKRMGKSEIPAIILELDDLRLRLAEIDENIIREDLHYTDKDDQMAEAKEIYEALHPETRAAAKGGGFKGNQYEVIAPSAATSFAEDMTQKTGMAPRTIRESVQRAEGLTDESKQAARELDLRKKEATALARMDAEKQRKAIEKRAAGEVKDIRELTKPVPVFQPNQPQRMDRKAELEAIRQDVKRLKDGSVERVFTSEMYLAELQSFSDRLIWNMERYKGEPYCSLSLSQDEKNKIIALNTAMLEAIKKNIDELKG